MTDDPLSPILDDPAVLKASEKFVRLIVRRPHAYEFKNKDKSVPGIVFLDGQGKVVAKQLVEKMNELKK